MKLANLEGRAVLVRAARTGARGLDLATASGGLLPSAPEEVLRSWPQVSAWYRDHESTLPEPDLDLDPARLGPPSPQPRQIFAVALNYRPHAAEAGFREPADPLVFTKFPSCLTGPVSTVDLPGDRVDWEVELVVVIGNGGTAIGADAAWDAVAGLTVGQDISERQVQMLGTPPQFSLGKSFPGFGPTGPWLSTPDEVADPADLKISCTVNGVQVQSARTGELIFPIPELISRLSRICPLLPGDLIFTGTPGGVGNRMDPPQYLTDGDELVSTVEGLGELRTTFRAPA